DAPCPRCGSLVWFPAANPRRASAPAATVPPMTASLPGDFTLDDFCKQLGQIAQMYEIKDTVACLLTREGDDPKDLPRRVRGRVQSMTAEERPDPALIDRDRRRRIAAGSGTRVAEVEHFLSQFEKVRELMRGIAKMSLWRRIKMVLGLGPRFS